MSILHKYLIFLANLCHYPEAMKARLLALVVDLLLDCFSLLVGPDQSAGIAVSTIPELAAALLREDSSIAYVLPEKNEHSSLKPSMPKATMKLRAALSSASRRSTRGQGVTQAAAHRILRTDSRGLQ